MNTNDIKDMPNLVKRLGDDAVRRVNYAHNSESVKGKNVMNINNTVITQMQGRRVGDAFCPADDIVKGICRLDHYSQTRADRNIPLSCKRMYSILQTMEVINTREVMILLGCAERQARRYVKACKIIMPFLEESLRDDNLSVDIDDQLYS